MALDQSIKKHYNHFHAMIKLNRRVTIKVEGNDQNEIGGPVTTDVDSWEMWAEINDRTGSNFSPNDQTLWSYDYRVIMRDERTRPIKVNYTIIYQGQRLKIESITRRNEAFRMYVECRCSTIESNVSTP